MFSNEADIRVLIGVFEDAERAIIKKIENTNFTNRAEKEKVLKQIQNTLLGLYDPTSDFVTSKSKSEYQSGISDVQQALGKLDFKGTFQLVDPRAAQFIMGNIQDIQDSALSDVKLALSNSYANIQNSLNLISKQVKNELATEMANDLVSSVAKGQVLGTPRKAISRELARKLKENGITSFTYSTAKGEERNLSLGAYVEGLARSTLINSRASAVVSQALEMGQDLLKIDSHSNPSPMCTPWSGKIVSITGKTDGYPTLSEALFNGNYKRGGIFHRWCRHSLTVYIPTNIKFN